MTAGGRRGGWDADVVGSGTVVADQPSGVVPAAAAARICGAKRGGGRRRGRWQQAHKTVPRPPPAIPFSTLPRHPRSHRRQTRRRQRGPSGQHVRRCPVPGAARWRRSHPNPPPPPPGAGRSRGPRPRPGGRAPGRPRSRARPAQTSARPAAAAPASAPPLAQPVAGPASARPAQPGRGGRPGRGWRQLHTASPSPRRPQSPGAGKRGGGTGGCECDARRCSCLRQQASLTSQQPPHLPTLPSSPNTPFTPQHPPHPPTPANTFCRPHFPGPNKALLRPPFPSSSPLAHLLCQGPGGHAAVDDADGGRACDDSAAVCRVEQRRPPRGADAAHQATRQHQAGG